MSGRRSWRIQRAAADLLHRVGLIGPAFRAYESLLAANWRNVFSRRRRVAQDELPVPPAGLRVRVGPTFANLDWFLTSGARHAELIVNALSEAGARLREFGAILDFGCGCGRVVRHWQQLDGPCIYGSDVQPEQIEWCRENLTFARFAVNGLRPPLPYADAAFDLVYALSVFTHTPETVQVSWIKELERVLRPGGYLLFTTQGEHYLGRLTEGERKQFSAGRLIVLYEEGAGTGLCSAYHPPEYVRDVLGRDLTAVSFIKAGASGHDVYLFRKAVRSDSVGGSATDAIREPIAGGGVVSG